MRDVKDILDEAQESMDMAIMYLDEALAHIRAGKADIRLLDGIRVDSYGSMVPINNVAAVTTPDARSIAIKPWDKSMFRVIEKAIIDSSLGIMPENNGENYPYRHPTADGRTPEAACQTMQGRRRNSQSKCT